MKEREILLGCDFEETRVKIKKDKNHFARLENKEMDEKVVTQVVVKKEIDTATLVLPFGLK